MNNDDEIVKDETGESNKDVMQKKSAVEEKNAANTTNAERKNDVEKKSRVSEVEVQEVKGQLKKTIEKENKDWTLPPSQMNMINTEQGSNSDGSSMMNNLFSGQRPSYAHPLEGLDKLAITTAVEDLQRTLRHLQTENKVLFNFLLKNDSAILEVMDTNFKQIQMVQDKASLPGRTSTLSKLQPRSKSSYTSAFSDFKSVTVASHILGASHEMPKINLNQRSDLVLREMEDIQAELEAESKKGHDVKFNLVAKIEELETRKAELEESIESFEKFKVSQEIMTVEKFVRYMNEWSKKSRIMVDKIRLRYSSLKVQYYKISAILVQKQLIGENLQEIDFEQLRIENLHLVEKIEKKNLLLLELKRMTGAGNLMLSQQKRSLLEKIREKDEITKAIQKKEKDIFKSDEEIFKLYREVDEVKHEYYKIKDKVTSYTAPDVLDYIKTKAELTSLKRDLKMWSRRKNLKDMALTTALNEMKRLLGGKQIDPTWFK
ncbi:DUF4201 domain containing protein [Asbolus verrucosus]|uniref:Cilia- and flagella-associated protein 263 n=1 Tax=Asbolus verrucosus TaxID=1661398 RepID=A0A482VKN5_ASBVE|nr:DUF4201 domain containing protein [Asbolus verrucosus]